MIFIKRYNEYFIFKVFDFKVCFFVNSGSEANELAIRLAREYTKARGMITTDHGYFGNTTGAIDISAYKFNKPGGVGQPDWLELVEIPDDYRGKYKRGDPRCVAKSLPVKSVKH